MSYCCKWGDTFTDYFDVECGTKQGGILSPDFFSVYINDLIDLLRKENIGCHILSIFLACIVFADDFTLLAPTRAVMTELVEICRTYCTRFCLKFNPKKTKVLVFGNLSKRIDSLAPIVVDSVVIEYVSVWRYLGFYIKSGVEFSFCGRQDLVSFYRATNGILRVLNRPNEEICMKLLFTNCIPIITYGCSVKEFCYADMSKINTAINDAIRRIFSFHRWESVRALRENFGYDSIFTIFHKSKVRFMNSLTLTGNTVLNQIVRYLHL